MPDPIDNHHPEPEAAEPDYNQLNTLGNRAIALGVIVGHGYRGGDYELLQRDQVVLLKPQEAIAYLKTLIQSTEQLNG